MRTLSTRCALALALAMAMGLPAIAPAQAQQQPAPSPAPSPTPAPADGAGDRVEIRAHYDNAVGSSDAASQGVINAELLKSRPALRPGEVLEFVPGVIVTQHSGDGKANQYFLRGFNLDHGTDFATTVAGMPVNMPTHGHGQGYTDLNFLIPELVQRIEYRKGPYFASHGDFAAAGAADIAYRTRLDENFAQLSLGERGYRRGVMAVGMPLGEDLSLLAAVEALDNDGPWTVPEGLRKRNGVLTLSGGNAAQGWSASLMGYRARWTSTDQIPQRLLDAGSLDGRPFGRFDSLDASDGGSTSRSSLSAEWHRNADGAVSRLSAYLMRYELALYSNFTYALERPDDGDQFAQKDRRHVGGLQASHAWGHLLLGLPARTELGLRWRQDRIRVGLFDTVARRTTATTRDDAVRESMLGAYAQSTLELGPQLRAVLGLRADRLALSVDALSLPENGGRRHALQLSPKLSLIAGPFAKTEVFFNAGRGLHSNDARGATARVDPRSGEPVDAVPPLVAARGFELGARTEALQGLQSSLALWTLASDSELVYVGDAGSTEASAASRRRGVEFNNRYTPLRWLLIDADFAWTHARFRNGDRIPNAVDRVASVAATLRDIGPWSASLQWRYLGSGALVEDNSVRARSSLSTNLRLGYRIGARAELTLDVFNLFDRKLDDIQYFYESRLPGEAAAVADRHVHPAEPRSARLSLRLAI
ncbi:MAG: TonB-dependent receptor [Proteobacteria bacterium]|nr:TonB-dependent receptor [Pseudomonadota bacterium]